MLEPPDLRTAEIVLRPWIPEDLHELVAALQDPEIPGWVLQSLDVERLELATDPENVSSQRVAEKAGFRREGLLRRYLEVKCERRDCVMFSLLKEDL